jgi:hypothetical protein
MTRTYRSDGFRLRCEASSLSLIWNSRRTLPVSEVA